jgi:N-formylmaleamate deformylase
VRGRGLSEAADALDYSLDAQAPTRSAFAKALGLRATPWWATRWAPASRSARPQRHACGLTRVVAVDPPVSGPGRRAYPPSCPGTSTRSARRRRHLLEQMRTFCPTWTEEQLRLRAQWLHTCDERAIVTSFEAFPPTTSMPTCPHVKVPLLLITAERGDVVRPEDADEILRLLPNAAQCRVPNAGHMIPWDNEAGFYAAFGRLPRRAARLNPSEYQQGRPHGRQRYRLIRAWTQVLTLSKAEAW